jgi:hypothetical protein
MNHDGGWRRINKDLTMMNHTMKKSKRESWHWGIGCDGEGQVNVWVRGINQAMKSHIVLSGHISWIKRTQGDMEKKMSLDYIRQRNLLSPAQGKVAQVKIMLRPSSFDKDEKRQKKRIKLTSSSLFLSVLFPSWV